MRRPPWPLLAAALAVGCAAAPGYDAEHCPTYSGLEAVRVNPAGAPHLVLRLQASFKVCPPEEGLAEIERKRIELRHEVISLLSGQTEEQLREPLRAERLREKLMIVANQKVMKKGRVVDVYITGMELQ